MLLELKIDTFPGSSVFSLFLYGTAVNCGNNESNTIQQKLTTLTQLLSFPNRRFVYFTFHMHTPFCIY